MACVNARATDSRRVAPACCMCAPDTLMGLKRGTSRAQNSITSAVSRSAASTGKSQVARVAVLRRAKARVFPKRPQTAAIHRGIDAACEGKFSRVTEVALVLDVLDVFRSIERRYLHAPGRLHWRKWPCGRAALPTGVWRLMRLRIGLRFHGYPLRVNALQRWLWRGEGSVPCHPVLLGNWATAVPWADNSPS